MYFSYINGQSDRLFSINYDTKSKEYYFFIIRYRIAYRQLKLRRDKIKIELPVTLEVIFRRRMII